MNRTLPLLTLFAFAIVAAGCVRDTTVESGGATTPVSQRTESGGGGTKSASDKLKIAVVPKGTTHEFWQTVHAGADAAGKELNCEILWNGPKAETEIQEQIDIINNYANQGVDGVSMAACDKEALVQTVKDLEAKGIPVVTIDSGIEPDVSRSFIATDNVEAAKLAAREMGRLLGGKGKVAVLIFQKGAGTSDQREQGFLEGIKEFPGIKVIPPVETKSDTGKAADAMETLLSANPDLNGVFAANEPNVVGAAGVVEAKKLTGKVKVIGFDASKAEIEYLKKKVVQGVVVQDPFKMGYEGVKALAQIVRGQGTPEKRIDTGAKVITPENMDTPEMRKLLYPLEK